MIINRRNLGLMLFRLVGDDGQVSLESFHQLMTALRDLLNHPEVETDLLFSAFDTDGDQALNRNEFKQLVAFCTGRSPQIEVLNRIWECLDSKKCGAVTRQQYLEWLLTKDSTEEGIAKSEPVLRRIRSRPRSAGSCFSAGTGTHSRISPLDVYRTLKIKESISDTRPYWNDRHHIIGCEGDKSIHPYIRGYFIRTKSECCTAEGQDKTT